jgi:radical SAM additional 4Fe4S-binding domain
MKFGPHIKLFEFADIPMIGNADTGDVIGLSVKGLDLCQRIEDGRTSIDEAAREQPDLFEHLEMGGFLAEPYPRSLEAAYLHITQRCNLHCIGCYSDGPDRNRSTDLSLSAIDDIIAQLASMGVRTLNISGGEPFLRKDLPLIAQLASRAHGIPEINILTNGTIYAQNTVDGIAPFVKKVSVSFDGISSSDEALVRGSQRFDELVSFVKLLQKANIPVVLTATVHRRNIEILDEYVRLANRLGATMNYSLLSPPSHGMSEFEDLAFRDDDLVQAATVLWDLADKGLATVAEEEPVGVGLRCRDTCGAGARVVSVGADGTLFPCHMMHDDRFALGNLLEKSLEEILASSKSESVSLTTSQLNGCKGCDALPFCAGGCRARSVASGNGIAGKDAYCAMHKAYYNEAARRLKAALEDRS